MKVEGEEGKEEGFRKKEGRETDFRREKRRKEGCWKGEKARGRVVGRKEGREDGC